MLLAPPVGGRTAREWSRAEPRVSVYGWVARKTMQFTVIWCNKFLLISLYPPFIVVPNLILANQKIRYTVVDVDAEGPIRLQGLRRSASLASL